MATYAYNAINAVGLESDGTLTAPDLASALEQLRQRGLLARTIDETREAKSGASAAKAFNGVKSKSLQVFSRQFATMIEAGLNVVSSLVILEQQTNDKVLGQVVAQLRD